MFQRASEQPAAATPKDIVGRIAHFSDGTGLGNLGVAPEITIWIMKNEDALVIESAGPIGSAIVLVGLLVDIQESEWRI